MTLSLLLIITPPIKYFLELICHHVVADMLVPLADFIHDPIRQKID